VLSTPMETQTIAARTTGHPRRHSASPEVIRFVSPRARM
jgi:hypothetical protein